MRVMPERGQRALDAFLSQAPAQQAPVQVGEVRLASSDAWEKPQQAEQACGRALLGLKCGSVAGCSACTCSCPVGD